MVLSNANRNVVEIIEAYAMAHYIRLSYNIRNMSYQSYTFHP